MAGEASARHACDPRAATCGTGQAQRGGEQGWKISPVLMGRHIMVPHRSAGPAIVQCVGVRGAEQLQRGVKSSTRL